MRCACRGNRLVVERRRGWGGVRIEDRLPESPVSRPKAATDHFMRVGLARYRIGMFRERSAPSGKTGYRQIEGAPKEMHGTAFAEETRPEFLENPICIDQNAAEALDMLCIV